jgi:hypothetical protein
MKGQLSHRIQYRIVEIMRRQDDDYEEEAFLSSLFCVIKKVIYVSYDIQRNYLGSGSYRASRHSFAIDNEPQFTSTTARLSFHDVVLNPTTMARKQ